MSKIDKENDSPSIDKTNRFAVDALIRKHGYKIHERKTKKEALWEKNGIFYRNCDILIRLDEKDVCNAEYMEFLYWNGFE